jgi:type I restriction enzyme, S subunit
VKTTPYIVGDVIDLVRRPVGVEPDKVYREIGIRSFGKGIFHKEPVSGAELGSKRVFRIEPGDLIFSNVFAWEGAVAEASYNEQSFIGSHRFMTYLVNHDIADTRYLYYYFISDPGLRVIRKASPGSAGRNKTLGAEKFASKKIILPDIDEQRRIAAKLDKLLPRVRSISSREPDERDARDLITGGIAEILQYFAEGTTAVGEVCDIVNDLVRPGDDPGLASEFVGLEHIASHYGLRISSQPIGNEKGRKFRFAPGDVLYGYLRPYLNKVWVADRHGLCSVEQYVLRPSGDYPAEFIAFGLRNRVVLDHVIKATNNLQLPRLRSGLLLALQIPFVPQFKRAMACRRLEDYCTGVRKYVELQQHRRRLAEALYSAILNSAFQGQL